MREVVIIDAVRTPIGKRGGGLSSEHAIDLLGTVQAALFARTPVRPSDVGQVVGGCVGQIGMQSMNITRTAWLAAGLPVEVAATTVDSQCGSAQQASTLAFGLIASGVVDVAVACGVEVMSRVPMGSTTPRDPEVGKPINSSYWRHHEFTTQFEAAERIAEKYGFVREALDAFGLRSQQRARDAWARGRFDSQIVPVEPKVAGLGPLTRDECLRDTDPASLAALEPTGRPDGLHTAGTSSQIADGAAAALLMSRARAEELGLEPLATVVDACLVGCDPVLMLEGPIPVTELLLERNHLVIADIDLVEINEAFASVVLAWQDRVKADPDIVNPDGGAIAHGHPLGATGVILLAKAAHALAAGGVEHALVTMCCGGGMGTGTLLRRS